MSDKPEYGTKEFYFECFSDIIGDLSDDHIDNSRAIVMLQAFEEAIDNWLQYHDKAARKYRDLKDEFDRFRDPYCGEDDVDLPPIPAFPSIRQ